MSPRRRFQIGVEIDDIRAAGRPAYQTIQRSHRSSQPIHADKIDAALKARPRLAGNHQRARESLADRTRLYSGVGPRPVERERRRLRLGRAQTRRQQTVRRDQENCKRCPSARSHLWVRPFAAEPFHMRIGRGSSVTVIDFESLPVTTRIGTGARGMSGSLSSERSNCKV